MNIEKQRILVFFILGQHILVLAPEKTDHFHAEPQRRGVLIGVGIGIGIEIGLSCLESWLRRPMPVPNLDRN